MSFPDNLLEAPKSILEDSNFCSLGALTFPAYDRFLSLKFDQSNGKEKKFSTYVLSWKVLRDVCSILGAIAVRQETFACVTALCQVEWSFCDWRYSCREIRNRALRDSFVLIKKHLFTCCDGPAASFLLESAELQDVVEEKTRRTAIQVRKSIHALSMAAER